MLNSAEIEYHATRSGRVVIHPFIPEHVGPNSYDVRLGQHYYRQAVPSEHAVRPVFNPFSERSVRAVWQLQLAAPAWDVLPPDADRDGIFESDRVIMVAPGEMILCHTEEFIGGRRGVTSNMHARSTTGRSSLEVCKCAGVGDVGYFGRWTLEVTNNSPYYWLPLVVGRRLAQLTFDLTGLTWWNPRYWVASRFAPAPLDYAGRKYQSGRTLAEIMTTWRPESMLPRWYADREVAGRVERDRRLGAAAGPAT